MLLRTVMNDQEMVYICLIRIFDLIELKDILCGKITVLVNCMYACVHGLSLLKL